MPGGTTTIDGVEVQHYGQSGVRIETGDLRVYVDVCEDVLPDDAPTGDLVMATHDHWDHFDPESMNRLAGDGAAAVIHATSDPDELDVDDVTQVEAGDAVTVKGVDVEAVPAHNLVRWRNEDEVFHPEGQGVGLVFDVGGTTFYHPGDTEPLDHMAGIEADVMFVPIGGAFIQSLGDAHWSVHLVGPDVAIPVHYGFIDDSKPDADGFEEMIAAVADEAGTDIEARIL